MLSYIALPSTAPVDLFAATGTILNDVWVLVAFAIGIPLAFFIIDLLISIVRPEHAEQYTKEELEDAAHGIQK